MSSTLAFIFWYHRNSWKNTSKNPPSVWLGVPSGQIPTSSAVQRNIKKLKYFRNQIVDELNAFLELGKIDYTNLKESRLNS